MKIKASKAGNFFLGISISRQTTLPLWVHIGLGWWVVFAHIGTPVHDIREKRGSR